jgi:hypothetical protein
MTIESCINFCTTNGFVFAGTEFGVRAFPFPFSFPFVSVFPQRREPRSALSLRSSPSGEERVDRALLGGLMANFEILNKNIRPLSPRAPYFPCTVFHY